ncbi:helix-turn-helix domain-containing protein [Methanoculleus sp. UBA303]
MTVSYAASHCYRLYPTEGQKILIARVGGG